MSSKLTKLQKRYRAALAALNRLSLDVLDDCLYLPFTSQAIAHAAEVMRKEQKMRDQV